MNYDAIDIGGGRRNCCNTEDFGKRHDETASGGYGFCGGCGGHCSQPGYGKPDYTG